jgi:hypothetical protein
MCMLWALSSNVCFTPQYKRLCPHPCVHFHCRGNSSVIMLLPRDRWLRGAPVTLLFWHLGFVSKHSFCKMMQFWDRRPEKLFPEEQMNADTWHHMPSTPVPLQCICSRHPHCLKAFHILAGVKSFHLHHTTVNNKHNRELSLKCLLHSLRKLSCGRLSLIS